MDLSGVGRICLILGGALILVGLLCIAAGKIPFLGRLPGDLLIKRDSVTVYVPLATCLLLSVVLTLLLNFFSRK
jgi:hypothetical protein